MDETAGRYGYPKQGVSNWSMRFFLSVTVCFVSCLPPPSVGIPIDNEVTGSEIQCHSEAMTVQFETRAPFRGRLFVKGMADNTDCIKSYTEPLYSQETHEVLQPMMTFQFGECNMLRARTLNPQKGMMQSLVVVISFHSVFVTKVDRAYRIQCFYMEAAKTVTAGFDVSMLTTSLLEDGAEMPTCVYSVRRGHPEGQLVRYALVGDEVYHRWECDSTRHAMLVKTCFVDDGQGNRYEVIDDRGCAMDPVIMPNPTYDPGEPRVVVEAHVFKFADKPTVFFQCTIQLCSRGDSECTSITPPNCFGQRKRRKRLVMNGTQESMGSSHLTSDAEIDLFTEPIAILDMLDYNNDATPSNELQSLFKPAECFDCLANAFDESDAAENAIVEEEDEVCLSNSGFGLLLCFTLSMFVASTVLAITLCYCNGHRKASKAAEAMAPYLH